MKKLIYCVLIVFLVSKTFAQQQQAQQFPTKKNLIFENAYLAYPSVPRGMLEAIAYTNTRMVHLNNTNVQPSCVGLPQPYGIMGLIENGKNYFRNNLITISQLSGISVKAIKTSAESSVMAYAAAYSALLTSQKIKSSDISQQIPVLRALSELPLTQDIQNDFAMNSDFYVNFKLLNDASFQTKYHTPKYQINLEQVFGVANYRILSATRVNLSDNSIMDADGNEYSVTNRAAACSMPNGPNEYATAIWNAANTANYGGTISPFTVAIHDIEGKYSGAISWFKNAAAQASSQYVIRSYDGQVTQMVCHRRKAFHVRSENVNAVGIEHEGFASSGATWYGNAMYASSADVVRFMAADLNINLLQTYDGPGINGRLTLSNSCTKIKGHQSFPNNTHVDPGPQWDWIRFYKMLNPMPAPTASSISASGTMYDSGGAAGNYANEERTTYLINPGGTNQINLTFNTWDVEANFDYLWIYDGTDDTGNLIGKFSGTSPGSVSAFSGAVFMEFRSDCGTSRAGWDVSWTTTTTPSCGIPINLITNSVDALTATLSWGAVSGATAYSIQYKNTLETTWHTATSTTNSVNLTGLQNNAFYNWKVQAVCGTGTSAFAGATFTTPPTGSTQIGSAAYSSTECSGTFNDGGGTISNYSNYENWTYTIQPTGASNVTLAFTAFDVESNFDFLKIYDGPTTNSALIGSYTGTTSPGTITSSGGVLTIKFTSDNWTNNPGWAATWSCNGGGTPPTLPSTAINQLNNWYTTNFTANYTDIDNSGTGLQQSFYQVMEFDGSEWTANGNNGFFNDNFNTTIRPDWTKTAGTWGINTANLEQTDEVSSNTNINIPLTQTNQVYLYHWQMQINGTGTNRRAGLHFYADNPSASNRGNSYLIYFRADNNKTQIYDNKANVITLQTNDPTTINAGQWYDCKVIYNPTTGVIKAYLNDALVSSWTDPAPLTSANSISLRTGNCSALYNDVKVYRKRTASTLVTVGTTATNDIRFQNTSPSSSGGKIRTLIVDNTEQWSLEAASFINTDWTAPSTVLVNDGQNTDIDTSFNNTIFNANWTASTDANSGISEYFYYIGTLPGDSNTVARASNGTATSLALSGLTLAFDTTYYITVIAKNGARISSIPATSDGVLIVPTCLKKPSTTVTAPAWASTNFQATFSTNDSCLNGIKSEFYQITDFDGSEWRSNGSHGFFNDNFNAAIHPDWTVSTGTWSIDFGRIKQSDETLSNTNIYAPVTQTNNGKYLYEWSAIMDGSGGNRRGGLHFFIDNPILPNRGNSYFVWFRVDGNKMQIYKVTNDVFSIKSNIVLNVDPGVEYNQKVIYDPATGKIEVYRDDVFIGSWTDTTPLTSGGYISLRTGNALIRFDNVRVFKQRTNTETATVRTTADMIRYQNPNFTTPSAAISTYVLDSTDQFSFLDRKFVNMDWTAPILSGIADGTAIDIDTTFNGTSLSANWNTGTEPNSAITNCFYAIGTAAGDSNTVAWTSVGLNTAATSTGLNLISGTTYYTSVRCDNTVNLTSSTITTNGQIYLNLIPPTVSNDTTYCNGETVVVMTATPNSGGTINWYSDAALTNLLNTGVTYMPANALGLTTYYVAENVNGVLTPNNQIAITINTAPTANAGINTSICNGTAITLTATGGTTYLWDNGLGTTATPTVSPTTTTQYNLTVTNTNNCSATDFVTISVTNPPVINTSGVILANASCGSSDGTITGITATGTTLTYLWQNASLANIGTSVNLTAIPMGVYNLSVTDANACIATTGSYTITELGSPTAPTASNPTPICNGNALPTLTATGNGGTLTWYSDVALTTSVTTGANYTVTNNATASYYVTETNGTCESVAKKVDVVVNANPIANAGANTSICNGTSTTLTATGGTTYLWDNGLGTTANPTVSPITTTQYNLTVTNANNCTTTDFVIITVTTSPTINQSSVVLTNASCGSSDGAINGITAMGTGLTYLWQNAALNNVGTTLDISAIPSGVYTLSVTNSIGCTSFTTAYTIIESGSPNAPFSSNPTPICNGATLPTLNATGSGGTLTWYSNAGLTTIVATGGIYTPLLNATATYYVTETNGGCESPATLVNVVVNANPTANAGINTSICNGTAITLTATGGTTYLWNNGLGTTATPSVSPTTTTQYNLTVTNTNNCSATDFVTISVTNPPVINTSGVILANASCGSSDGTITGITATGTTLTYLWQNASLANVGTSVNLTAIPMGIYNLSVTDVNACIATTGSYTITESGTPTAPTASNPTAICSGNPLPTLTATGNGGTLTWYSDATLTTSVATGVNYTVSNNATASYYVTETNGTCESVAKQVDVVVNANPIANAGANTSICNGTSTTLTATGGTTYLWDNGLGTTANPTVSPITTTQYNLTVTNANNCTTTDFVIITVTTSPTINQSSVVLTNASCGSSDGAINGITNTGTGLTYLWQNAALNNVGTTLDISAIPSGVYTLTVTDGNSCSSASTPFTINQLNTPVAPVAAAPSPICDGNPLPTITAIGNGGTINWYADATLSIFLNTGTTYTPTLNASASYYITETSGNCTSASFKVDVIVNANPITNAGTDATICSGNSTTLTATGGGTYLWDNGLGTTATPTVLPTTTTQYNLTVTNTNNCSATNFVIITVNPTPVIDESSVVLNNATCGNADASITGITASGTGLSYQWLDANSNTVGAALDITNISSGTYTLIVTNSNSCSASSTAFSITEAGAAAAPSASNPAPICSGDALPTLTSTGTGGIINWYSDAGLTNLLANGNSFTPTVNTTATYYTTENTGICESPATAVNVVVNATPTANAGTDIAICNGNTTTLTATGSGTYLWDNGLGTNAIQSVSPSVTTQYNLTVTNVNNCSATHFVVVTVNTLPQINTLGVVISDASCGNTDGSITGITATGTNLSYQWVDANNNTVGTALNLMNIGAGTYTLSVTNSSSCTATTTAYTVIEAGAPTTPTTVNPTAICSGSTLPILTATGGAGVFNWYSDAILTNLVGTGSSFTITQNTTASYYVTETSGICESPATQVNVVVNTNPIANAGVNTSICIGSSTNLTASGGGTYLWDNGLGANANPTISPTVTTQYNLTVMDANNCSATDFVVITVNPLPIVSLGADETICANNSVTLSPTGGVSYVWNNGLGTGITQSVSPLITTTYSVTGTDVNGCSATDIKTVFVDSIPNASFYAVDTVLYIPNLTATFINNSSGATTYFWDFGDGNSSNLTNPTHTYADTGSYIISLLAMNSNCPNSALILNNYITILDTNSAPIADFNFPSNTTICVLDSFPLTNNSINTITYNWSVNNGATTLNNTAANPNFNIPTTGTYNFTLVATNFNGSVTITQSVFINVSNVPSANFTTNDTLIYTPGAIANFTNLSTDATNYVWNFGDGNASLTLNPTHTYFNTGFYSVSLVAENGVCPNDTVTAVNLIEVQDLPVPIANFDLMDTVICALDSFKLINNTQLGDTYQWFISGGTPTQSTAFEPTVFFPATGVYQIMLVATNAVGSNTFTKLVSVTVLETAIANFTPSDTLVYLSNAVIGFTNNSTNATSYFWDFGDGNTSTNTNPWNTYSDTGSYTVTLIANSGTCSSDTTTFIITIKDTPTGIENNLSNFKVTIYPNPTSDDFTIVLNQKLKNSSLQILNSLGQLVYQKNVNQPIVNLNTKAIGLSSGVYHITISNEKQFISKKLIVK